MAQMGGISDVAGGISDVEGGANSQEIESLARFAIHEHNKKENSKLEFKKVLNAKQQVVEGFMYYITMEAMDGNKTNIYEAKVWVKSWMNFKELEDFKLIGEEKVGGITDVEGSANSQEMESLARFAIDEHNKKENSALKFKKVVKAKQQVVAGMIYYITMEAMDGNKLNIYEANVWVKVWMNFKELQGFKLIGDAPAVHTTTA